MTLQPIPSEFPYVWGKFCFLFYQSRWWSPRNDWQKHWDLPGFRPVCRTRKVGIILRLYRAELALLGFANPNASMRNQSTMLGFASWRDRVGMWNWQCWDLRCLWWVCWFCELSRQKAELAMMGLPLLPPPHSLPVLTTPAINNRWCRCHRGDELFGVSLAPGIKPCSRFSSIPLHRRLIYRL